MDEETAKKIIESVEKLTKAVNDLGWIVGGVVKELQASRIRENAEKQAKPQ